MNYSDFNNSYKKSFFKTEPAFIVYQEDNARTNKYKLSDENRMTATKGILCEDEVDPVTELFFSPENMKRIQKMIRHEAYIRTNGGFKLEVDQDESDLLVAMRAVFFDTYGARFLPFKIKRQVKDLNIKVVNYILPDMISEMKQGYGYLKEINEPIKPLMRPLNVNNAGRRTLPSITTIWGV